MGLLDPLPDHSTQQHTGEGTGEDLAGCVAPALGIRQYEQRTWAKQQNHPMLPLIRFSMVPECHAEQCVL